MRIIALDNYDNHFEGEEYDAPETQARHLIEKGLAKAGTVPKNKMAIPEENKGNPSEAAGEEAPSSASQAARPSRPTPAKPSAAGAKPRGRPRKTAK